MADLFSAIGQGLGAVGGPLVSGGLNLLGGLIQQGGQQSSIQSQENFQANMSDTAYQRSVADMTKAGLNPALMYGSGGPESTPSGASMMPPNVLGGVASSAMDTATSMKQMQVMDSQIANNLADALNTSNKAGISDVEGGLGRTAQSMLNGVENFIQGWGKSNANASSISNLFGQLKSGAGPSGGMGLSLPQPGGQNSNDPFQSADAAIDNFFSGR